jgi:hypothetical protein
MRMLLKKKRDSMMQVCPEPLGSTIELNPNFTVADQLLTFELAYLAGAHPSECMPPMVSFLRLLCVYAYEDPSLSWTVLKHSGSPVVSCVKMMSEWFLLICFSCPRRSGLSCRSAATTLCSECSAFLCSVCEQAHVRQMSTKGHKTVTLEQVVVAAFKRSLF